MLARELYNMKDAYKCESNDYALRLFKELRRKIGNNYNRFVVHFDSGLPRRLISERQFAVSEMAVKYIASGNFKEAIRETYDFLHNYGDDDHELTNPEYAVLNIILCFVEQMEERAHV